ncbi:cupin domain-containing protein [Pseudoroseicyclus tamaricis]|uniref:Cupin domain-containing protein n=1 Tax=Pseudoroseicyclus tamaricis TaxID=2705421 RepID=A0A6B2JXH1_9RHOB|nr:cupin domain-containing protein [Pseudoroseicyclus tamaricis]NDV00052.1 cupin domain-containing protein [Pseudoroseicyclus tamaricis]
MTTRLMALGAVAALMASTSIATAQSEFESFDGGTGTVIYNRAIAPCSFFTAWSYVDRVALEGEATIGPVSKEDMSEVFYVISGTGEATIDDETVEIMAGRAIPAALGESRAFSATGDEPLDMMIIGVARDIEAKEAYMVSPKTPAPAAELDGGTSAGGSSGPPAALGCLGCSRVL